MKLQSRILLAVAALSLFFVFVYPLWSIQLKAPQYPQGLGMYIWVDDITGHDEHDLQNINILNHYIGMQEIDPELVAELDYMPYIFAFLIGFGLLAALVGRRSLLILWLVLLVATLVAGLVDFYIWGYNYGHNLSPDAPIKVPGMSYQPPLIGTKQLLNITSTSLPYVGSLFVGLSMILGGLALYLEIRKTKETES